MQAQKSTWGPLRRRHSQAHLLYSSSLSFLCIWSPPQSCRPPRIPAAPWHLSARAGELQRSFSFLGTPAAVPAWVVVHRQLRPSVPQFPHERMEHQFQSNSVETCGCCRIEIRRDQQPKTMEKAFVLPATFKHFYRKQSAVAAQHEIACCMPCVA